MSEVNMNQNIRPLKNHLVDYSVLIFKIKSNLFMLLLFLDQWMGLKLF